MSSAGPQANKFYEEESAETPGQAHGEELTEMKMVVPLPGRLFKLGTYHGVCTLPAIIDDKESAVGELEALRDRRVRFRVLQLTYLAF